MAGLAEAESSGESLSALSATAACGCVSAVAVGPWASHALRVLLLLRLSCTCGATGAGRGGHCTSTPVAVLSRAARSWCCAGLCVAGAAGRDSA